MNCPAVLTAVTLLAALVAGCQSGSTVGTRGVATATAEPGRAAVSPERAEIEAIVARHAAANGVPGRLAAAMVRIESNYNPNLTGRRGEVGLMQIKYATAQSMGYTGSRAGLYDPETNITYGMRYLAAAQRAGGGTVCGAVLKYQGGLRATRHSDWTRKNCGRAQAMMASG